jgi:hypothetical protein
VVVRTPQSVAGGSGAGADGVSINENSDESSDLEWSIIANTEAIDLGDIKRWDEKRLPSGLPSGQR